MSNKMYDGITGRSPIATDDLGYIGTGQKASQIMANGTTDYNDLSNKPTINDVELSGNKTSSDLGLQSALTTEQLSAVNSGVTAETVAQVGTNTSNISLIDHASGTKLFFTETEPTGTIPTGSYWLSTNAIKIYARTNNLFNKATALDNKRVITTGIIDNEDTFASDYIVVEASTEMSITGLGSVQTTLFFYDSNTSDTSISSIQTSQVSTYTFTVPTGVTYMRFTGAMSAKDSAMLNVGSSVLPYEPYLAWS